MPFRLAIFAFISLGAGLAWPQAQETSIGAAPAAHERDRREQILSILSLIREQGPLEEFPPQQTTFSRDELATIPPELLRRVDGFLNEQEAFHEAVAAFEAMFQSEGLSVQVRLIPDETQVWFLPVGGVGWLPYWDGWFEVSSDKFSGNYLARVDLVTGEVTMGPNLHMSGFIGRWQRQSGVIEYALTTGGQ